MAKTIADLIAEAREMLNDVTPISGDPRYEDVELIHALNDALMQLRSKRPDAWLGYGLRKAIPQFGTNNTDLFFPVDEVQFYPACLFYVVGRAELSEDTFSDDGRAVTLMNKFITQILAVKS